jgi:hypothetical protein
VAGAAFKYLDSEKIQRIKYLRKVVTGGGGEMGNAKT